jgi:hypothetical protein
MAMTSGYDAVEWILNAMVDMQHPNQNKTKVEARCRIKGWVPQREAVSKMLRNPN